jgi:hypothetical protein
MIAHVRCLPGPDYIGKLRAGLDFSFVSFLCIKASPDIIGNKEKKGIKESNYF